MYRNKKASFNFNFFVIRITAAPAAAAAVFPLAAVVLRCRLPWGRNAKALHGRLPRSPAAVWSLGAESVTAILKKVSIPTTSTEYPVRIAPHYISVHLQVLVWSILYVYHW
jgi:hypothetical protein